MSRAWRLATIVAATCALAAVGTVPALAQSAQKPVVKMNTKSAIPPVTHDVFVIYSDTHRFSGTRLDQVKISGSVSQSTSGQVAALFAQRFPFKSKPKRVASVTLPTSTTPVRYNFTATPTIATKYTVEVLASSTSSSPIATSRTKPVYVVTEQTTTRLHTCGRPVCHQTVKIYTHLPSSAYKVQSRKKWDFYFGLRLSTTGEPAPPRWFYLKRANISKVRKVSSTEFERTISWSFRIGNDGYYFIYGFCSKDSESRDGINLPGSHSCGVKKVSTSIRYLG